MLQEIVVISGYLASIDKVRHVFIYLQQLKNNNIRQNPYIYDTFKYYRGLIQPVTWLSTCRLEYGNGVFYPELDYDQESKSRIFSDLMNYSWKKNDYNTGTQLNVINWDSLYPLLYFDLSYQAEQVKQRSLNQLILRYRIKSTKYCRFSNYMPLFSMNKILLLIKLVINL